MAVRLLFFASCADWVGRRTMTLPWTKPAKVSDLVRSSPELAALGRRREDFKVAVNLEYADFDSEVVDGDEVAFLPPVSGG